MSSYWNKLNRREQGILGAGIPFFGLILFYLYAWQPTVERLEILKNEIPVKSTENAWVKYQLKSAGRWLAAAKSSAVEGPILTIIEKRAIEQNIKASIQRVQPDQNKQVKMWFRDVAADNWFAFVDRLSMEGILVESAAITRTLDGKVNVRVTFKR